ncbi:hypothetical protein MSG28_014819 [Choristoneura fumiferana]|uniref:Uncharacterized protein n=1 Tax=Choristoneura fumiferana TaxID=7141 RepID=A0ACC0JSS0_CHOFU|nr:hypothetical protein MSG28_014819 [Choristoneura fumiferana]
MPAVLSLQSDLFQATFTMDRKLFNVTPQIAFILSAASVTKSFRNHLKAAFRLPSFKTEKVSLKKTVASKNKQRCERNGVFGTVSCPDLSLPRRHKEPAKTENNLHKPENVGQHNTKQMLSHRLWPTLSPASTTYNLATIAGLIDADAVSLKLFDIFGAFACPQIPPGGLPYDVPCKWSKCSDGCYQVTFDTPQPCKGPGTHSETGSPNHNCFPTCSSCGGYCQKGGQCGCTSCRGWGPYGPCGLCCCCAAPNSNANAGQTFYAPCSPEALRNPSQACIGTVLCSSAAPVDCCYSGSTPADSACSHGCGCGCCHHGWDSYHSPTYQPSSYYGQCHCHCCCCAAQLAAVSNYEPDPAYFNNYDSSCWGNSYGCNSCTQHQYDPSWCNYGCGYHNASLFQYSTPYQYNYAPDAAISEDAQVPCIEAPVCEAELAESSVEAASPQESSKQPPEPPKCIKNISSPAPDAATACFCPDCTKKPESLIDKAKIPDETAPKPLPPPRWHGINPTLAKNYPFNSTTRKYHQRTTPVNMARASISSITLQAIKAADADLQARENSDEVEMPQIWSFPESYKRFFDRMTKVKTINLKSLNGDKPNEKMRF